MGAPPPPGPLLVASPFVPDDGGGGGACAVLNWENAMKQRKNKGKMMVLSDFFMK
jgi:hypothetical protein